MIRYQGGDRGAFAVLVSRHRSALFNFALRQLGNQATAEEVVQDAFVRVVRNAGDFKHAARFSTWLYTIARNLCVDEARKRVHRKHPSLDQPGRSSDGEGPTLGEQTGDGAIGVERLAASTQLRERVVEAIAALPDDQREVFLMREVSGLPFKEIAVVVGVSENTIKSRMRYALERLQLALSEFEEYARALR